MLIEAFSIEKTYPSPPGWRTLLGKAAPRAAALTGASLKLAPGAVTGLIGPNGAGKTTLLRILSGRLLADSGSISIDGRTAEDPELRAVTAMTENGPRSFYQRLTAEENLRFFGALYGLSRAETAARAAELAAILHIREEDFKKRFDALSDGAAQKFSLARTVMRRTPILFLDEPARNLDLGSSASFSAFIKRAAEETGAAVLYTSHNPAELARVCAEILVLKEGKISARISAAELKKADERPGGAETLVTGILNTGRGAARS